MSRLDELKKQYPQLNLSFFDILTRIDGSKSYKYLPLLCKLFSKRFDLNSQYSTNDVERAKSEYKAKLNSYHINTEGLLDKEAMVLVYLTEYWDGNIYDTLNEFQQKMENSQIENTDVTSYNSIEEVRSAISLSELRSFEKEMENQVIKEHEDDNWLIVRPLTFAASIKYGSGTKWCTTSKKEKSYFESYWRRGSLIYYINKKTGYKFASFRNFDDYDRELSFWNAEDNRVDFMYLNIDDYMFGIIKKIINVEKTNKSLCTTDIILSVEKECVERHELKSVCDEAEQPLQQAFLRVTPLPINHIELDITIMPTSGDENSESEYDGESNISEGFDVGQLSEMVDSYFEEKEKTRN
jgi:hypothetical protein